MVPGRRVAEGGGIEPLIVRGVSEPGALQQDIGTLSAPKQVGVVAGPANDDRCSRVGSYDAADLETAEESVGGSIEMTEEPALTTEGQLIAEAGDEQTRDIVGGEGVLAGGIVLVGVGRA